MSYHNRGGQRQDPPYTSEMPVQTPHTSTPDWQLQPSSHSHSPSGQSGGASYIGQYASNAGHPVYQGQPPAATPTNMAYGNVGNPTYYPYRPSPYDSRAYEGGIHTAPVQSETSLRQSGGHERLAHRGARGYPNQSYQTPSFQSRGPPNSSQMPASNAHPLYHLQYTSPQTSSGYVGGGHQPNDQPTPSQTAGTTTGSYLTATSPTAENTGQPSDQSEGYSVRCECGHVLTGAHANGNLTRHQRSNHCTAYRDNKRDHICEFCNQRFRRSDALLNHKRKKHGHPAALPKGSPTSEEFEEYGEYEEYEKYEE